ncbi:MAG: sigma factor [Dethiobacteria bacterium]|nr:sigma factor [Dethiobacteria bacterium]
MLVNEAAVKLINRCKRNDEDAYNQLLSQYEAYLFQICYNYTRSKEEALDMMQEVYIKIFRGIKLLTKTGRQKHRYRWTATGLLMAETVTTCSRNFFGGRY